MSAPTKTATNGATTSDASTKDDSYKWAKKTCPDVLGRDSGPKNFDIDNETHLNDRGLVKIGAPGTFNAVFINKDNLWDGTPQILRYWFMEGTDVQQTKVKEAIDEWTWYANIQFTAATAADESDIRIQFDPNDGSWSYVAKQAQKVASSDPTMNLAWLNPSATPMTTNERAVILHEFGHVLGLLHEHQSPAHGGVAVKNVQAAYDFYHRTQGWTMQQVYDQVINVEKMVDVSNFSQVDTSSIMHYPQPKELTGLAFDIPYNEKLDDLDKAYIMLQYPRKTIHPKAAAGGWSYKKALDVMNTPPDVTAQVLDFLTKDADRESGEIDPQNIRATIATWSRAAHSTSDSPAGPSSGFNPSNDISNAQAFGSVMVKTVDGADVCSTEVSTSANGQASHAVMNQDWMWPLPIDGDPHALTITYGIRECNVATATVFLPVTAYHRDLVTEAVRRWSNFAYILFVPVAVNQPVDMLIQFNNDPTRGPDGDPRSSTSIWTGVNKKQRRSLPAYNTTAADLAAPAGNQPWLNINDADIKYNGIFPDDNAAAAYTPPDYTTGTERQVNGRDVNLRSVMHEIGHWLGLHHEYSGLYSFWMRQKFGYNVNRAAWDEARTLWSTRYDNGSIMDCIGVGLGDAARSALMLANPKVTPSTTFIDQTSEGMLQKVGYAPLPTKIDNANIALIYPGFNMVDFDGTSGKVKLKTLVGTEMPFLDYYLDILQLKTKDNLNKLGKLLLDRKWTEFRKQYLSILKNKQEDKAETDSEKMWRAGVADMVNVSDPNNKGQSFVTNRKKKDDIGPEHDISDPSNPVPSTAPAFKDGGPFITQLYEKLSQLYNPGGGQYFALQFPTRFLDKETYAYKLDGYFSRFEKPVVVNEAEFALTDALYEVAPLVGGPNGQSLSKNYSKALNSLIPTFENIEVRKQRELMREWLMKETKAGNSAFTTDTRLSFPGITEAQAQDLSQKNGLTITAGPSTGDYDNSALAVEMAQDAIDAIKRSGRADPRGMTRMEYSDSLMQAYLNDRKTWELQRDDMIKTATDQAVSDPQSMEKLTRRLAHITAIEEAKLASKYADAVVRGYSHTVRGFMGHLDIKSTAEFLQDAKDSFRESALSSVYAASSVYPVAMLPTDWFQALDTNFTREDLSQDKDLIKAAVMAKSQLIDNLETQIGNLRAFNKGDPAIAKKAMDDASAARETALANLSKAYTASTISAVKIAIQIAASAAPGGAEAMEAEKAASIGVKALSPQAKGDLLSKYGLDDNTLTDIATQMDAVASANSAVNAASRNLTEHMSEYASAVAGDTTTMIETLQTQLTTAKAELLDLQQSYTIAARASNTDTAASVTPASDANGAAVDPNSVAAIGKLPQGAGGSRWSEIHIQSSSKMDYTSSQSHSESSVSSFSCNFWIGSYSQSNSSASANNQSQAESQSMNLEIAMRTTYVTVDRSGWFDPSLFEMSKSFMQGVDPENYVSWCAYPGSAEAAANDVKENGPGKPKGYLAAFPVGYVLVKDCVIKILNSTASSAAYKKHFDESSEKSGGFLCFSASTASRSSSDSSASTTVSASDGLIIRIPGPQILGYVMQVIGKDQTQQFKPMPADQLFIEDMDDDNDKTPNPNQPAHDVGPSNDSTWRNPGRRQATIRDYDNDTPIDTSKSTLPGPAHDAQAPPSTKPGNLVNALENALAADDVTKWLASQPANTKDELWKKLMEAFGKS